jgi:hypothetical protein
MDIKKVGLDAVKILEALNHFDPPLPSHEKMAALDAASSIVRSTVVTESFSLAMAKFILGGKKE